jgi:hypothetical protein
MTVTFKLVREDGTPAEPASFRTGVYVWRPGDTIPLGATRTLRVVAIRDDDADQPPALVVEDLPGRAKRCRLRLRRFVRGRVVGSVLGVRLATRP